MYKDIDKRLYDKQNYEQDLNLFVEKVDSSASDELNTHFQNYRLEFFKNIIDLITLAELTTSKSEAKRLVEQGGVKLGDKTITDWQTKVKPKHEAILKVGKRKFVQLMIKK